MKLHVEPTYETPAQPVTTGVPFSEGSLTDISALTLSGVSGPVPLQVRQLSAWPDGSVRWALLDFQVGSGSNFGLTLTQNDASSPVRPSAALQVDSTDRGIRVNTGPLQFFVSSERLTGIEDVTLNGRSLVPIAHNGGIVLDIGDGRYELGMLTPDDVVIEESGPLRAVIRSRGHYETPEGLRFDFIFRIHAYAGLPWLRVHHTFTNPTDSTVRLNELALELPLTVTISDYTLGGEGDAAITGPVAGGVSLVQSPHHNFQHFDDHEFRVTQGDRDIGTGSRAGGWMQLSGVDASVTVAVRDFWQLYPKGFRASSDRFAVDLWPKGALPTPAGHMDVNAGAARTHELLLAFGGPGPNAVTTRDLVRQLNRPPMAHASTNYYASTGAVANGELSPAIVDGKTVHPEYEDLVQWMLNKRYLKRRQERDEYGIMHFGDYLLGNRIWNSLQYELPRSFTQQFFRTGDRQFLDLAGEMVRGQRDILVLWHNVATKGHRAQRSYGGEWEQGEPHCKVTGGEGMLHIGGVIDYYLLTGDLRTRDALLWMADGLANVRESMAWFRPQGMGWRAGGYPLKVLAEAFTLTRDEKYREQAVRILEEMVFPNAHTVENGFDPAIADGVWWVDAKEGEGWRNQAWMVDQIGDGLSSVYKILEEGPVKDRTLKTFLDVADWTVNYAWKSDPGGLVVRYNKSPSGDYVENGLYKGFIAMLGVCTMSRAYTLTGEERYLDVARQMFQTAVEQGRQGVNEGKQIGQVMQYAPIYMATEANRSN